MRGAKPSARRRASRGDRGLPDLAAAPCLVFSGSRTTSSVSGTTPQRVLRWRKSRRSTRRIRPDLGMGEVARTGPAEIDVAEIDEEPLASGRQPALQRQHNVLDLIVDTRELEAGEVRDLRIGVVIDLLVEMKPRLLVGRARPSYSGPSNRPGSPSRYGVRA